MTRLPSLPTTLIFPTYTSKSMRLLHSGLPFMGQMLLLFTMVASAQDQYGELAETILRTHSEEERLSLLVAKPELEGALVNLGNRRYREAKYEDALLAYTSAERIADGLHDFQQGAFISSQIGDVYSVQGKYRLALEYYQKGLQFAELANDKQQAASAQIGIGSANYWLGEYELALEHYQRSLVLAHELHHPSIMASSLLGIGLVHYT